jgi:hypothetical protein
VRLGSNAESLRYALLTLSLSGFWAAYHYWTSVRTFDRDDARMRAAAVAVQAAAA